MIVSADNWTAAGFIGWPAALAVSVAETDAWGAIGTAAVAVGTSLVMLYGKYRAERRDQKVRDDTVELLHAEMESQANRIQGLIEDLDERDEKIASLRSTMEEQAASIRRAEVQLYNAGHDRCVLMARIAELEKRLAIVSPPEEA